MRHFDFPFGFCLLANCSIASYRFAYGTVLHEQSRNSRARKFSRRGGATRSCRVALTLLVECQWRRRSLRNSKTSAKIQRISRTVRRIDSSFRGRCYEMDPYTTPRARWRESKRERREKTWVSPSHPPPPSPLHLRDPPPSRRAARPW